MYSSPFEKRAFVLTQEPYYSAWKDSSYNTQFHNFTSNLCCQCQNLATKTDTAAVHNFCSKYSPCIHLDNFKFVCICVFALLFTDVPQSLNLTHSCTAELHIFPLKLENIKIYDSTGFFAQVSRFSKFGLKVSSFVTKWRLEQFWHDLHFFLNQPFRELYKILLNWNWAL